MRSILRPHWQAFRNPSTGLSGPSRRPVAQEWSRMAAGGESDILSSASSERVAPSLGLPGSGDLVQPVAGRSDLYR